MKLLYATILLILSGLIPLSWGVMSSTDNPSNYFFLYTMFFWIIFVFPNKLRWIAAIIFFIVGVIDYINIKTVGLPLYPTQFAAFLDSPILAIEMASGATNFLDVILGIVYMTPFLIGVYWLNQQKINKNIFLKISIILPFTALYFLTPRFDIAFSHTDPFSKFASLALSHFNDYYIERQTPTYDNFQNKTKKIVLFIGESESADLMQLHGGEVKNTPLLSSRNDIIVFNNMAAVGSYTGSVVSKITTFESGEDILKKTAKPTFWQIATATGYETARVMSDSFRWGSFFKENHKEMSFAYDSEKYNKKKDMINLEDDQKVADAAFFPWIKGKEKFFATFRMTGSHVEFKDRYPKTFKKFESNYDNSILYTDHFLNKALDKVDKDTIFFFTSDHSVTYDHGKKISAFARLPQKLDFVNEKDYAKMKKQFIKNSLKPVSEYDFTKTIVWLMGVELDDPTGVAAYNLFLDDIPDDRIRYSADPPYKESSKIPVEGVSMTEEEKIEIREMD